MSIADNAFMQTLAREQKKQEAKHLSRGYKLLDDDGAIVGYFTTVQDAEDFADANGYDSAGMIDPA